jgi:hypothetical protein
MKSADTKSNIPWSVKGVSKEAREAAKKAAAEQGVTMGEWLTRAIRSKDHAPVEAGPEDTPEPVISSPAPAPTISEPLDGDDSAAHLRRGITERIEHSEQRILAVVAPLQEIIQQMALRIEALEGRGAPRSITSSAATPAIANSFRKTGWDE